MASISSKVAPGFNHLARAKPGPLSFRSGCHLMQRIPVACWFAVIIWWRRSWVAIQPWRRQLLWLRPQRVSGSLECLTVHSSGRPKAGAFACPRCARRRLIQRSKEGNEIHKVSWPRK